MPVKYTLLDMVQRILSAMDSDEVNSIHDSTEALQVAYVIESAYNSITSRGNLPEHFELFELNASGDPTKPTLMTVPDRIESILWIKYDKQELGETDKNIQKVDYMRPDEFLDRMHNLRSSQGNVVHYEITNNGDTIDIFSLNNVHPQYWTSWDDRTIIFDSYQSAVDTTLVKNKTVCYGEAASGFLIQDDFVPDLDARQFDLLMNEAKSLAFAELKQAEHARAERNARRGWVTLANQKDRAPARPSFRETLPNYGRK